MNRRRFPIAPWLLVSLLGVCSVAVAQDAAIPAVVKPAPFSLAGIVYDPSAALSPTEKPLFDSANPPSGAGAVKTYAVTFKGGNGVDVPATLTVPAGAAGSKVGVVILLHGLGGSKQDLFVLGAMLGRAGFASLSVDIAGHGARPKVLGKPVEQLDPDGMHIVAAQTVIDLRRAVDYLSSRPEIDAERVGFLGASLGGILGARFVADEPRVKAASLWAAGGNWGALMTTSQHPWAKAFRTRGATDPAKIDAEMRDVNPVPAIERAKGRPLLFLNGDKDDIVPPATTDSLIAAAKEPKERVTLPGGHIPNILEMASRSLSFFQKNLRGKG